MKKKIVIGILIVIIGIILAVVGIPLLGMWILFDMLH